MNTKRLMLLLCLAVPLLAPRAAAAEVPSEGAFKCGCREGSLGEIDPARSLPHYIELGKGSCADLPSAPPEGVYGYIRYSWLASSDYFGDHDWHDFNFALSLDPDSERLNSNANRRNSNSFLAYDDKIPTLSKLNERLMEVEWDSKYVDPRFMATAGDRLWMMGRYIWDCGHAEKTKYKDFITPEKGYHTEYHPPKAIALTRLEPYSFSPGEPLSYTNMTYVYIHGRSGLKYLGLDYLNSPVATEDYTFLVPVPPRPAGYPPGSRPESAVVSLPFGGPNPTLEVQPKSPGDTDNFVVKVTYPLAYLNDPSPNRKFGAIIASGWRPPSPGTPVPGVTFRRLRVVFTKLVIRKRHVPFCLADWTFWLNVNGQWRKIDGTTGVNNGVPITLGRVGVFDVDLPETPDARLTIQASGWVDFYDQAFGAGGGAADVHIKLPQLLSKVFTDEGHIGIFFKQFGKDPVGGLGPFGIGTDIAKRGDLPDGELSVRFEELDANLMANPEDGKGKPDTDADFGLSYRIEQR
jgi:hypothetical protein